MVITRDSYAFANANTKEIFSVSDHESDIARDLAAFVAKVRASGLSQVAWVARYGKGLSAVTLNKILNGNAKRPSASTMDAIRRFLIDDKAGGAGGGNGPRPLSEDIDLKSTVERIAQRVSTMQEHGRSELVTHLDRQSQYLAGLDALEQKVDRLTSMLDELSSQIHR